MCVRRRPGIGRTPPANYPVSASDANEGSDDEGRLGRVAIVDCIHETLQADGFHGEWFTEIGRS